jgi:hypothetical protein
MKVAEYDSDPHSIDCETCQFSENPPECGACPHIPATHHKNIIVLHVIRTYGPMIFDGETISDTGIKYALDLEGIPFEDQAEYVHKISYYFFTMRLENSKRMQKDK